MDLQDMVERAMGNALENGFPFAGCSAEHIATDLQMYDADLEGQDPAEVLVAVLKWQASKS